MIKINLLPQKRGKQRLGRGPAVAARGGDAGSKQVLVGVGALAGAAALVFFVFDMPLRNERRDLEEATAKLAGPIKEKEGQLAGYEKMKSDETDATAKIQAINRLQAAKVVPANVLHELGEILTKYDPVKKLHGPTMTERMSRLTESDPNKLFQQDWDPTHVWLSGFTDAEGKFKLEGGAQSRDDVTQLSKRLAASVYFVDVVPSSGDRVTDTESNLSYYKFTITGKVAY